MTDLETRLGKADFEGSWQGATLFSSGNFEMYLLRENTLPARYRSPGRIDHRSLTGVRNIEGFGFDHIGVWVFSGIVRPNDFITFTKNYSEYARKENDGVSEALYEGDFNFRSNQYEGVFTVPYSKTSGRFSVRYNPRTIPANLALPLHI